MIKNYKKYFNIIELSWLVLIEILLLDDRLKGYI